MNNIFRILFVIGALCILKSDVFAQCKYEKNEVDKFTNKSTIITKSEIIVRDGATAVGFALTQVGESKGVRLSLNLQRVFSISEGAKLFLKTASGVIELPAEKYTLSSGYSEVDYSLSQQNFDILKASDISDIRIELMDGSLDKTIEIKKAQKMKSLFSCIGN
jgi:hypothetical protein